MPPQNTEDETVKKELQLVAKLLELADTSQIKIDNIGWTSRVYLVGNGKQVVNSRDPKK